MASKCCQSCTYGRPAPAGSADEPTLHCYRQPPQALALPSGVIVWRRPVVMPNDGPCGEFKGA
jgi:hypothetical protein